MLETLDLQARCGAGAPTHKGGAETRGKVALREGLPPFDPLEGTPLDLPVFCDGQRVVWRQRGAGLEPAIADLEFRRFAEAGTTTSDPAGDPLDQNVSRDRWWAEQGLGECRIAQERVRRLRALEYRRGA